MTPDDPQPRLIKRRRLSSPNATTPSESSSTLSPVEPPILPLTHANLGRVDTSSASQLRTPRPQSYISSQEEAETESQLSAPKMPSESPHQVRELLQRNRLYINNKEGAEVGRKLIDSARKILQRNRGSDWSEKHAITVTDTIAKYSDENETTFLIKLMEVLLGRKRHVPASVLTEEQEKDRQNWIEKAWEKDHLRTQWQADFSSDSIPKLATQTEPYWDTIVKSVPRVANPRPDIAFSVYHTAFDLLKQDLFNHLNCSLTGRGTFHTFFILEAKSMDSSIQEAENQCMRSGAAMVKNRRALNFALTQKSTQEKARPATLPPSPSSDPSASEPGQSTNSDHSNSHNADVDSFAFSLAVASDQAKMYVNWALEVPPEGQVHWHMHRLASYSFDDPDELSQLHHDIDNILDWGIGPRKGAIEKMAQANIDKGSAPTAAIHATPMVEDPGPGQEINLGRSNCFSKSYEYSLIEYLLSPRSRGFWELMDNQPALPPSPAQRT